MAFLEVALPWHMGGFPGGGGASLGPAVPKAEQRRQVARNPASCWSPPEPSL